jgi:hypothetical protein
MRGKLNPPLTRTNLDGRRGKEPRTTTTDNTQGEQNWKIKGEPNN